jgi:hypothetical protein
MTIRRWQAIIIFALTFLAGVLTARLADYLWLNPG